ncbi:hypothetical protein PPERSA_09020 [Pseudocohnilembus persalinus]|uniref:Glutamate--cysteine ligase n=1 Tax=Pseudocohnilembus persalinus TaxID=266149 RepID=A0A0V0R334_PSEPJ|nr:hypothetical protein PPERSA_09020 [Pseudocohnilembus persalinus]|eukprot:KRX08916.1 hypothetical protein PPERSA_09020 [Pseudocohnilembus persalinus]
MGFLEDLGKTLTWEESQKYQAQLKKDGIVQFLNLSKKYLNYGYTDMHSKIHHQLLNNNEDSCHESFDSESQTAEILEDKKIVYWGDEIESHYVKFDEKEKVVRLQVNQSQMKKKIEGQNLNFEVHAEYGSWMVESVPKKAYPTICRYGDLIDNIRQRNRDLKEYMGENEFLLNIPSFPTMGTEDFHEPFFDRNDLSKEFKNEVTKSLFIDDRIITDHPRFPTLTKNIRTRRGEKVNIQVPLYKDVNTIGSVSEKEPYENMIYMDAMAFGMGSSCLQTTFSAIDFPHARWLYDQLSILSPIFLALTAGSPIFKGKLADIDTRWDIIAASVDDRNSEERNPKSKQYIPKSRYGSISRFISDDERNLDKYNDLPFPKNEEMIKYGKEYAQKIGIEFDDKFWDHIGQLFIRDALVIFENDIVQDNEQKTAHFENIQSTNWNSVRLKLPPSFTSDIGWRVEFRTTEVQLTDDENAAISMLVHILVRILYEKDWFKLNLYIPISKLDENFERSKQKDAILNQKFYFRTNIQDDGEPQIEELSIFEIFFGKKESNFSGIYGIYKDCIGQWSKYKSCKSFCCMKHVESVFEYIKKKCTGEVKTLAKFQRDFVLQHPDYKKDSIVSQKINYDLCKKMVDISYRNVKDENFPDIFTEYVSHRNNSSKVSGKSRNSQENSDSNSNSNGSELQMEQNNSNDTNSETKNNGSEQFIPSGNLQEERGQLQEQVKSV